VGEESASRTRDVREETSIAQVIPLPGARDAKSVTVLPPSFAKMPDSEWDAAMELLAEMLTPVVRRRIQRRQAA